jgi:starvation-inducible DNA-binding protein
MKQATKNHTRIDLPEGTRNEVIGVLNSQLADGIHLGLAAKQAHWNVKGAHFAQLHELFDKLYTQAGTWSDDLAERAVQLGGTAEGTLDAVKKRSRLSPYDVALQSGTAHLEALSDRLAAFGSSIRGAIDLASEAGDQGSADLFTGISREADKMLWMLEAHLQSEA